MTRTRRAEVLRELRRQARRMDEWDRTLALLDALPSCVDKYRLVTDARGVTHRERIPARFEPSR